ncbi:MAG: retropepsin-like aspartic protease family protein [Pelagimonas sp.]|uniref:retropepsin-like aspartic protease family protein n=1 Tax=Pelagimonas sp. TaxID=2073170 RepID=UPI003D6BF47E
MQDFEIANLIYLSALGAVLISWYFVQNKGGLSKLVRDGAAWVFIFVGTMAVIGLWGDIRQNIMPRQMVMTETGQVELPRASDGHYYVDLEINGNTVPFMVDTGATSVVLTQSDAARIGLDPDTLVFFTQAMTANGPVDTAPVTLDQVTLGKFQDSRIPAYVNGGDMDMSLLGMTYLNRFESIQITKSKMILER